MVESSWSFVFFFEFFMGFMDALVSTVWGLGQGQQCLVANSCSKCPFYEDLLSVA